MPRPTWSIRSGVNSDVAHELRRTFRLIARESPMRHDVSVLVVPHPAVTGSGLCGFGMTVFPSTMPADSGPVQMCIAAGLYDVAREHGFPHHLAVREVVRTFLHEWAHYEQWRDEKSLTERGVNVRAKNLYRCLWMKWSGRKGSNFRPRAPKARALPLRYAPIRGPV